MIAGRIAHASTWSTRAELAYESANRAHTRRDWLGVLASVDRERRARIQAAELYDGAARLWRTIGDVDGARRYDAAAAWERDLASVL